MKTINVIVRGPGRICELCGRSIDELRPFTREDVIALDLPYPVYLYEQSQDGKLGLTYRGVTFSWADKETGQIVEQRQVGRSWECFDCLTTAPDEIETILRNQNWICISQDKLHPMDELPDFSKGK